MMYICKVNTMIMSSISRISRVCVILTNFTLFKKILWKRNVIQYLTIDACMYFYVIIFSWYTLLNTYKWIRILITYILYFVTVYISVWWILYMMFNQHKCIRNIKILRNASKWLYILYSYSSTLSSIYTHHHVVYLTTRINREKFE